MAIVQNAIAEMNPSIRQVAAPILRELDGAVRQSVMRRIEAMERELKFLADREDENLAFIRRHHWSNERLQLVFLLNSVYQQVLGPAQAAARGGPEGLGSEIPVRYGNTSFDRLARARAGSAMRDFQAMVLKLSLLPDWLYCNTCGDVVFNIASFERHRVRR